MAKRMKIKVEIEFDCPDSIAPEQAFDWNFMSRRVTCKLLSKKVISYQKFTTKPKVDERARTLNEYRRIFKGLLKKSKYSKYLSIKGFKGNTYSKPYIDVMVISPRWPFTADLATFGIDNQILIVSSHTDMFTTNEGQIVYNKHTFNLSDPNSFDSIVRYIDLCVERKIANVDVLETWLKKRNESGVK